MAGKWKRIRPMCDLADCVNCEDGICGILDETNFVGECRFYRPRKPAPVTEMEPKEKTPVSFTAGQKAKIDNMWR